MRGGVGDYTSRLVSALGLLGVACDVITSIDARQAIDSGSLGNARIRPTMTDWNWRSIAHLRRVVSDFHPDVINLQYQTGAFGMEPAINILPVLLRRRKGRNPFIVTCHDLKAPYLFPKAGPLRIVANRILFALADVVIVTNEQDLSRVVHARERLRAAPYHDRAGRRSIHLIPIGSNIDRTDLAGDDRISLRHAMGISSEDVAIGFFGFVDEWKGVEVLIDAFTVVRNRHDRAKLVFVGGTRASPTAAQSNYQDTIARRIHESGIETDVIWTGFVEPELVSASLQCLDVCALPFLEGACYRHGSLIAAIEHNLPIVTTEPSLAFPAETTTPLPRLKDGSNALLVPPGDANALAAAMEKLIVSPRLREHLRLGVQELAPQFSWQSIARATLDVYEQLSVTR